MKLNSRWVMYRAGFVDFWYYDEQEFIFDNGRMLLRGSNGSGKSVTMQSIIPLLLDGNMRPERLDPFGSRDRKMVNYLLEEGDTREERTGYLYLELKREDSETYITIGIGLRARKGKKLDSWYFYIADGRRINQDFFLVEKKMGGRMALSKKELENRLGSGGGVINSQSEYMAYVNQQIFGFETLDEYKEMVDLLIQLRTPKLSRDFKPSIISEILSNSLLPLSEDDLRPMAESIENMDTVSSNLANREVSFKAAEKVARVYEQYNQVVLFEKAKAYKNNLQDLNQKQQQLEAVITNYQVCQQKTLDKEKEIRELENEQVILAKERETLDANDAFHLQERLLELQKMLDGAMQQLTAKKEQLQDKESKERDFLKNKNQQEEAAELKKESIEKKLEELEENLDFVKFDEFFFMKNELIRDLDTVYSFNSHERQLDKYQTIIKETYTLLEEVERNKKRLEEEIQILDGKKKERDHADRLLNEYIRQLEEIRNELKEKIYIWQEKNRLLKLEPEILNQVAQFIDEYDRNTDLQLVRQKISDVMFGQKNQLEIEKAEVSVQIKELMQSLKQAKAEKQNWEQQQEPEPERTIAVLQNRKRLTKLKIPFVPFYKLIDFADALTDEERGYLEEALLDMGILDALVIDEIYKDTVLQADMGMSDRYLFAKADKIASNLTACLKIDEVNNVTILNILESIGAEFGEKESIDIGDSSSNNTFIYKDGTYQLGVVTGTISKSYTPCFIGTAARQAHKETMIAYWEGQIQDLETQKTAKEDERKNLEKRVQLLLTEYKAFPAFDDIHQACIDYTECQEQLDRICRDISHIETNTTNYQKQLKDLQVQAVTSAQKVDLSCTYDVFAQAKEIMEDYRKDMYNLQALHMSYLHKKESIYSISDNIDAIKADIDNIRYDIIREERSAEKNQQEIQSVKEQLELTGYDEIKERLEYCSERLDKLPSLIKECIRQATQGNNDQVTFLKEQKNLENSIQSLITDKEILENGLKKELELEYLDLPEDVLGKERDDILGNLAMITELVRYLDSLMQQRKNNRDREACTGSLNTVVSEQKVYLTEHDLSLDDIFKDIKSVQSLKFNRLDLTGRFGEERMNFKKLMRMIEADKKTLESVLKAEEKELFEDILAKTVSRKIRAKINASMSWVDHMNQLMSRMNTSSGLTLSLKWRSKTAEEESQLDTSELVSLLKKDTQIMNKNEFEKLAKHFRSKVEQARRNTKDSNIPVSFFAVMKDTLDYRNWFEFRLFSQKTGEKKKELTDNIFGTFSGGEKAMSMYVPLFSAVVAKYQGARPDAPKIIALDEAFAGVDSRNIRDMFRLITEFEFNFIMNSQVLWGDCDTIDHLAIYQLLRPQNAKFVTVISYSWNGKRRILDGETEEAAVTKL